MCVCVMKVMWELQAGWESQMQIVGEQQEGRAGRMPPQEGQEMYPA